ncbi:hypothetical protein PQ459_07420 [Chryseobacterium sp. KACC 21268]|nr:hypothetical protein PQ459_07420 [Chryseobacterium sp. KACC 21268]
MKTKIIILTLLTISSFLFGQKFQKAIIQMVDGNTKTGFVNGKIDKEAKKIKFKSSEKSSTETLSIDLVKSFSLQDSFGESYEFENVSVFMDEKRKKPESLLMLKLDSGYYDLYFYADISFDKKGNIQFSDKQYNVAETPAVYYFIKKEKEKEGDFFSSENIDGFSAFSPFHKYLKKSVARFMSDDKTLVDKIESKKLSAKDIPQIVKEYNEFKASNVE